MGPAPGPKKGRRIFFGRSFAGRTALEGFFVRLGRKEVVHRKPLIFNAFLKGGIRYEKRMENYVDFCGFSHFIGAAWGGANG